MSRKTPVRRLQQARQRITQIRDEIVQLKYICSGTLLHRTKVCGKAACRCAVDRDARHGPYYEWTRRQGDRLVHSVLGPAEAALFAQALRNYRSVRRLLRRWERASVRAIQAETGGIR
jgi:hypothetical protein